ncbi:MAG: FkbM family methyltransferase [Enterobacteriaceae bacterium]
MNLMTLELSANGKQHPFFYRADSTGDHGVIKQIFEDKCYDFSRWLQGQKLLQYHLDRCRQKPSLIVDAGANIGAATVYFNSVMNNTFAFTIEPNHDNWQLCVRNTQHYDNKYNFHGAIASCEGRVQLIDPGHSHWGYRTGPVGEVATGQESVNAISVNQILAHPTLSMMTPLICKIDIEGAEQELFSANDEWVNKFPLIIIELHDWLLPFSGSSQPVMRTIAKYDFEIVQYGENLFLFNRALLRP